MSEQLETYATPDDLANVWHSLTIEEEKRAQHLLDDASQIMRDEVPAMNASTATKRIVCVNMVKRAMMSPQAEGVTQLSETTGPFANSFTFANPTGSLYLTRDERRRLKGTGRQRVFSVDLSGISD